MLNTLKPYIKEIDEELDVNLEIPHVAYVEAKKEIPQILLFKNPVDREKGITYSTPVLMNLFANHEITEKIFGEPLDSIAAKIEKALKIKPPKSFSDKMGMLFDMLDMRHVFPKRSDKRGTCQAKTLNSLDEIPILKTWSEDGGKFITMGQVYTASIDGEVNNVGMYRLQVYEDATLGLHWQIHKDSNHIFHEYKQAGEKMPVSIAIGGDPLYTWCATAPMPHGIFELLLYGFIRNKNPKLVKCLTNDLYVPEDADFVIEGWVDPEEMKIEGMFGDHTGYYTLKEPYPFMEVSKITSKSDPLYYATVVGKPPLEDKYMGHGTERIFLPLLKTQTPSLIDYRMPENGVFHNLILLKIKTQYPGHSLQIMHALWGVGQMSFVRHAIFVDETAPDLTDDEEITKHILDRIDASRLFPSKGILDALDHASNNVLIGGKIGIDATGERVSSSVRTLSDEKLFETMQILDADITAIAQYFTDTANPICVVQYTKTKPAKEIYEKLFALKEHLKIVVFVDEHNHVNNPYMLLWRVTNNIEVDRDVWVRDVIGIDGTNKSKMDGFMREWPKDVVCEKEVLDSLQKKGIIDIDQAFIERFSLL